MSPKTGTDEATPVTVPDVSTDAGPRAGYTVPVLHVELSERMVNLGFWGGLGSAVVFGAIDPPLGILIGAGVVVARHTAHK